MKSLKQIVAEILGQPEAEAAMPGQAELNAKRIYATPVPEETSQGSGTPQSQVDHSSLNKLFNAGQTGQSKVGTKPVTPTQSTVGTKPVTPQQSVAGEAPLPSIPEPLVDPKAEELKKKTANLKPETAVTPAPNQAAAPAPTTPQTQVPTPQQAGKGVNIPPPPQAKASPSGQKDLYKKEAGKTTGQLTTYDTSDILPAMEELTGLRRDIYEAGVRDRLDYANTLRDLQLTNRNKNIIAQHNYQEALDRSSRADFWQNMIQALGQIAAGGVAYATEKPVMDYYKPVKVFDKSAVDEAAKAKLAYAVDTAKRSFEDAMTELKNRTDISIQNKNYIREAKAKELEQKIKLLIESKPKFIEGAVKESDIIPGPGAGKAKEKEKPPAPYKELGTGTTPATASEINDKMYGSTPNKTLPVSGATVEKQAISFSDTRGAQGSPVSKEAWKQLYLYTAQRYPETTDPSQLASMAHKLIDELSSNFPLGSTKEAYELEAIRKKLEKFGFKFKRPSVPIYQEGRPETMYDPYNPNDRRAPDSYIKQLEREFQAEQDQKAAAAKAEEAKKAAPPPAQQKKKKTK